MQLLVSGINLSEIVKKVSKKYSSLVQLRKCNKMQAFNLLRSRVLKISVATRSYAKAPKRKQVEKKQEAQVEEVECPPEHQREKVCPPETPVAGTVGYNSLPPVQPNWLSHYNANQRKYNLQLGGSILFLIVTIVIVQVGGLINLNYYPPEKAASESSGD